MWERIKGNVLTAVITSIILGGLTLLWTYTSEFLVRLKQLPQEVSSLQQRLDGLRAQNSPKLVFRAQAGVNHTQTIIEEAASAEITPSAINSQILIIASGRFGVDNDSRNLANVQMRLFRDQIEIYRGEIHENTQATRFHIPASIFTVDTPRSMNLVRYSLKNFKQLK